MTRFIFWLLVLCSLVSCSSTQNTRPVEIETVEPVVITDLEVPQWDPSITEFEDVQAQYESFLASQTEESLETEGIAEEVYQELSELAETETPVEQTEPQNTLIDEPASEGPVLDTDNNQETTQDSTTEETKTTEENSDFTNIQEPEESPDLQDTLESLPAVGDSIQEKKQLFSPSDRKTKIAIFSAIGLAVLLALVRLFRTCAKKKKPKVEPEMGVLERFLTEEVKIVDEEKPKKQVSLEELLLAERGPLPDEDENPKNQT